MPSISRCLSWARPNSKGCSARQGTHQEAKKLIRLTWPFRSALFSPGVPAVSGGRSNAGTSLSIITDGTRLGSRLGERPCQNQPAMPAKTSAGSHQQDSAPDQGHQRLVIDAHGPAALAVGFADHRVEIGEARNMDGGLGGGRLSIGIEALFRRQYGDRLAVAAEGELRAGGGIVRPLRRGDAVETIAVGADGGALARAQHADVFLFPGTAGGHAQYGDRHA